MSDLKKLKLIYNPFSGDKSFKFNLDPVIAVFQRGGYETHVFRSMEKGDIENHFAKMNLDFYDVIVVSGGDGSVNIVVNCMLLYGIKAALGIIPSGTANDFATFLKLPKEPDKAAEVISCGHTIKSDIGQINGHYFINVCGAGFLTNISQNIDTDFKSSLGKLAYYIKGIEQITNFTPLPIRITNSSEVIEESVYLFIVLNSAGTGGFEQLSPESSVDDGLFEFIALKARPMVEMAVLFIKILAGDYLEDSNIIYFRDSYIKVEGTAETEAEALYETDIDGEMGPEMPIEILNIPRAIEIFVPEPSPKAVD